MKQTNYQAIPNHRINKMLKQKLVSKLQEAQQVIRNLDEQLTHTRQSKREMEADIDGAKLDKIRAEKRVDKMMNDYLETKDTLIKLQAELLEKYRSETFFGKVNKND
jgi:hypothetical protein